MKIEETDRIMTSANEKKEWNRSTKPLLNGNKGLYLHPKQRASASEKISLMIDKLIIKNIESKLVPSAICFISA